MKPVISIDTPDYVTVGDGTISGGVASTPYEITVSATVGDITATLDGNELTGVQGDTGITYEIPTTGQSLTITATNDGWITTKTYSLSVSVWSDITTSMRAASTCPDIVIDNENFAITGRYSVERANVIVSCTPKGARGNGTVYSSAGEISYEHSVTNNVGLWVTEDDARVVYDLASDGYFPLTREYTVDISYVAPENTEE